MNIPSIPIVGTLGIRLCAAGCHIVISVVYLQAYLSSGEFEDFTDLLTILEGAYYRRF